MSFTSTSSKDHRPYSFTSVARFAISLLLSERSGGGGDGAERTEEPLRHESRGKLLTQLRPVTWSPPAHEKGRRHVVDCTP